MSIVRPVQLWRATPNAGSLLTLTDQHFSHSWLQVIQGPIELGRAAHTLSHAMTRGDGLGWLAQSCHRQHIVAVSDDADVPMFNMN